MLSLQVTVIAQPATLEEHKMILEKFSVSLHPAKIRKCVSHMRDRTRDCKSLNGACFESQLNQLRKVYMNDNFA